MRATTTTIAKTQRQEALSTRKPPRKGPIRLEMPDQPAQAPIALPRSSSAKLASTIARLAGTSSAAVTPCRILATISTSPLGARAHSSEVAANPIRPMTNTIRRP